MNCAKNIKSGRLVKNWSLRIRTPLEVTYYILRGAILSRGLGRVQYNPTPELDTTFRNDESLGITVQQAGRGIGPGNRGYVVDGDLLGSVISDSVVYEVAANSGEKDWGSAGERLKYSLSDGSYTDLRRFW